MQKFIDQARRAAIAPVGNVRFSEDAYAPIPEHIRAMYEVDLMDKVGEAFGIVKAQKNNLKAYLDVGIKKDSTIKMNMGVNQLNQIEYKEFNVIDIIEEYFNEIGMPLINGFISYLPKDEPRTSE